MLKNLYCLIAVFLFNIINITNTINPTLSAADIALVTIASGDKYYEAVKLGIITKQEYCQKYGYDFICIREHLDPSRPPSWSKILLIQQLLPNYQWVFWSDADSLIMNPEYTLESYIDEQYSLIITSDPYAEFSAGHFLIKNCPWSFDLLERIYARDDLIHHNWWEQQALIATVQEDPLLNKAIKVLPQRSFNSFLWGGRNSQYKSGDFILHFANIRNIDELKPLMEKFFKKRTLP